MIAKYYYKEDLAAEELIDLVKKRMRDFNIEGYQEYRHHNKITSICSALFEEEANIQFRELDYIPIYENELKVINSLPGDRQKKFMFTLFAVARYMNCDGWINKKDSRGLAEVLKLANVTLPSEKRSELLHQLYRGGYISFGKKVNNLNIRVQLEDSGEIAYKITDFNNIGNQYIGNFKKGYKQCQSCGKAMKVAAATGRPKIYCTKCAAENQFLQKKQWDSTHRKRQNPKTTVS